MRIALEIVAVFERTRLALVGIHRKHPRRGLGAHQRPFSTGRKTRTAEAAQPGIAHNLDQFVSRALIGEALFQQRVSAVFLVGRKIGIRLPRVRMRLRLYRFGYRLRCRVEGLQVPDRAHRRAIARAHARRTHNTHILAEFPGQFAEQFLGTSHCT